MGPQVPGAGGARPAAPLPAGRSPAAVAGAAHPAAEVGRDRRGGGLRRSRSSSWTAFPTPRPASCSTWCRWRADGGPAGTPCSRAASPDSLRDLHPTAAHVTSHPPDRLRRPYRRASVGGAPGRAGSRTRRPHRRARLAGRQPGAGVDPLARGARPRQRRSRGDARPRHDRPPDVRLRARRAAVGRAAGASGRPVGRVDRARPPRALSRGQRQGRRPREPTRSCRWPSRRRAGFTTGRRRWPRSSASPTPAAGTRPRCTPRSTRWRGSSRPATAATAPNTSAAAGCTRAFGREQDGSALLP